MRGFRSSSLLLLMPVVIVRQPQVGAFRRLRTDPVPPRIVVPQEFRELPVRSTQSLKSTLAAHSTVRCSGIQSSTPDTLFPARVGMRRLYLTRPEMRRSRTSPECGRNAQKPHVLAKRGYVKCVTLGRAKFYPNVSGVGAMLSPAFIPAHAAVVAVKREVSPKCPCEVKFPTGFPTGGNIAVLRSPRSRESTGPQW